MASNIFLLFCISKLFTFVSMLTPSVRRHEYVTEIQNFVYWQNGTIPFYINPSHFDKEQMLNIMSSLSLYSFKTCLQFNPVMAEPGLNQHVLVFENPDGVRKCIIGMTGHAKEEAHRVTLGYECLKSPNIDMIIMKALGFPFEHNRASRDVYINVQYENIESGSMPLFTKEAILPFQLRALPYDVNSVMHFGERDFSKNGHRTIIFKNGKTVQNRLGLSDNDVRKIELVYGPECLERERQAKIDICRNYPVIRRKREIDFATVGSLRVNPDITPPQDPEPDDVITNNLKELGIEEEVQTLIDQIHKITAAALKNAKLKHCNATHNVSNDGEKPDLKEIINKVTKYTEGVVQNALVNITVFCDDANPMEMFQIGRCQWGLSDRCPVNYRSTKSGRVKYSTQHRPLIRQSTKHEGKGKKYSYVPWLRTANGTDEKNMTRDKRGLVETNADDKNNASKDALRMATKIVSDKRINYAPSRRSLRDDNRDESEDTQVKQRKRKLSRHRLKEETERDAKHDSEDERPRQKKKESDERLAEDGSKEKIVKERKERKTFRLPKTVKLSTANREFYDERMWPDGVVYYVIKDEPKYDINKVRERLAEVNRILRRKTCVRLKEITADEADRTTDYLILDTSRDYVTGRVGGKQNFGSLELFEGGQHRQHAAMMVMAMLGFYFEISRHDRDKYIRVHNRHIRPDKLHHFEKIRSEATLPLPYDYASATQPAWQYWRVVGRSGISTVATYKDQDPDGSIMKSLGQNSKLLSDTDIVKINSVYGVKCFQNQRRMKIRFTKSVE